MNSDEALVASSAKEDKGAVTENLARMVSEDSGADYVPDVLFHYTGADGLLGMLTSGSLWASNALYLNDSSELSYIRGVASEVIESNAAGLDHPIANAVMEGVVAKAIFEALDTAIDIFVVCLCEESDVLSQWREYGAGGAGYAVGFEFRGSNFDHDNVFPDPRLLKRVVYDRGKQVEMAQELLRPTIDRIRNTDYPALIDGGQDAID